MRRSLAVLLLLASPALGQAPEPKPAPITPIAVITAPASIPAGAPLVVFADQSTSSSPVSWKMKAPRVPFEVASLPGRPNSVLIIRQPTPGTTYQIALIAFGTSDPGFDFDFADVAVELPPTPNPPPPTPAPTPDPVPTPPPAPSPVVQGRLEAVLIYSMDDPSTAHLRVSDVKAQLKALDCGWSVIATASPLYPEYKAWLPASGVPAVLVIGVVNGQRTVVKSIEGPTRPADVASVIKALRGAP